MIKNRLHSTSNWGKKIQKIKLTIEISDKIKQDKKIENIKMTTQP